MRCLHSSSRAQTHAGVGSLTADCALLPNATLLGRVQNGRKNRELSLPLWNSVMPKRTRARTAEAVQSAVSEPIAALGLATGDAVAEIVAAPKRSSRSTKKAGRATVVVKAEAACAEPAVKEEAVEVQPAKKKRNYANAYTRKGQGFSALVDKLAFEDAVAEGAAKEAGKVAIKAEAVPPTLPIAEPESKPKRKGKKAKAVKAEQFSDALEAIAEQDTGATALATEPEAPKKRQRKSTKKAAAAAAEEPDAQVESKTEVKGEPEAGDAKALGEADLVAAPKRQRKRRQADPNAPPPFEIPSIEILAEAAKHVPGPRPVPNLGFACLNATLRSQKPPIFSNRDCIKRTWEAKGLDWVSQLCCENTRALIGLILWNHLNGIRFFRMSSKIFPWCTEWSFEQLPQKQEVADNLAFAGKLARAYDQRLTFHPSHFVKLGCEPGPLLDRSLKELEVHSQILDLMGYKPSVENKINIHIGGMYGDKEATILRFAENFKRLSPSCKTRLTVENDDWANAYSVVDLLTLNKMIGIPIVFDFHHHRFCTGGLSEEDALKKALATWPEGIRPVVHWSESQEGRKPSAHSDFVKGPLRLYGLDEQIDVMIEAKGKELALLRLRDPNFQPTAAALATICDDG